MVWTMSRASVLPAIALFLSLILAPARAAVDEPLRLEVTEHTDVHHEFTGTAKSYGVRRGARPSGAGNSMSVSTVELRTRQATCTVTVFD